MLPYTSSICKSSRRMDSFLWRIDGARLTSLRRPDLPKVARAIVDAERGEARVFTGYTRETPYVRIHRVGAYDVFIRGEDWDKIVPFLRNTGSRFSPAVLPSTPPPPIPSPQPNRTMQPPPPNPWGGLRSFVDKFDYQTMRHIEGMLTAFQVKPPPSLPSKLSNTMEPNSQLDAREEQFYNNMLQMLQQLFPDDFPA